MRLGRISRERLENCWSISVVFRRTTRGYMRWRRKGMKGLLGSILVVAAILPCSVSVTHSHVHTLDHGMACPDRHTIKRLLPPSILESWHSDQLSLFLVRPYTISTINTNSTSDGSGHGMTGNGPACAVCYMKDVTKGLFMERNPVPHYLSSMD